MLRPSVPAGALNSLNRMSSRLRILHVTRNLPPLVGGMERLNWHIADELVRYADVRLIGPTGCARERPESVEVDEVPLRPLWRFLQASAWKAVRTARVWKPQLVLAGSGLTAPAALVAARVVSARSGVYLHGLDVAVRHPIYRALWYPAMRKMDCVIANSHATAKLTEAIGVDAGRLKIIHPGVALPGSSQEPEVLEDFRRRHKLGDARLLVSVGRLTSRKGLLEFVEQSLPSIVQNAPDTLLVVIGAAPLDSLYAEAQTLDNIQATADGAGIGGHLRFLGVITDPVELACAYESASVHVFPVRNLPGDPEGFGMVAVEAAAHGVPTVAFATGGIVDAVAPDTSGYLIPSGDYRTFAQAVVHALAEGPARWQGTAQAFAQGFSWPNFGERLYSALAETARSQSNVR